MARSIASGLIETYYKELLKAHKRAKTPAAKGRITTLIRTAKMQQRVYVTIIRDDSFTTCIVPLTKKTVLIGVTKRNSSTDQNRDVIGELVAFHRAVKGRPVPLAWGEEY